LWAIGLMRKLGYFKSSWEYTLGMKKLSHLGLHEEAMVLWHELRMKGLDQTPATYSAAIVALNSGKKWQEAVSVFDEMQTWNMAPIRVGCEHMLMACEKGKLWEKALHVLDEMWEYGMRPNEDSYLPAINACENAQRKDLGDTLFREMREATKLERVEQETGYRRSNREPPKAEPTPWRLPGAIALDAYDPPNLLEPPKPRSSQKKAESQEV